MTKFAWLNSLTIKVFIGFWFIAIAAVTVTRVVYDQFFDQQRVEIINKSQKNRANKILKKVSRSINRHSDVPLKKRLTSRQRLPPGLWFKSEVDGKVYHNSPLDNDLKDFIKELEFTQAVSVKLAHVHLLGPFKLNIKLNDQIIPFQVFIDKPISRQDFAKAFGRLPIGLRLFTALIVTGLLSWILSWYLISPLKKLTLASNTFGQGNLSVRLPEFDLRRDEVGQLGQAFNTMADKLQDSIAAQQRLLGDVSHELRSPLTRLQLALTLAKNLPDHHPNMEKYFSRFDTEINRLDKMIGDALKLSRLENQLQAIQENEIHLSAVMLKIVQDAELMCQPKHIIINKDICPGVSFLGDEQLIYSAIENIVNNAIRYSPEHAQISITLATHKDLIIIKIIDQGPGVDSEHINKIFTPFYRTADARDRVSGGTGLGLAIASHAINCHDGTINAKLASNNKLMPGLAVTIKLPLNNNSL